jgi:hypothetical protein
LLGRFTAFIYRGGCCISLLGPLEHATLPYVSMGPPRTRGGGNGIDTSISKPGESDMTKGLGRRIKTYNNETWVHRSDRIGIQGQGCSTYDWTGSTAPDSPSRFSCARDGLPSAALLASVLGSSSSTLAGIINQSLCQIKELLPHSAVTRVRSTARTPPHPECRSSDGVP